MNFGYGLRWAEPKARGFARVGQLLREPASGVSACIVMATALALYGAALGGAYAVVQSLDGPTAVAKNDLAGGATVH